MAPSFIASEVAVERNVVKSVLFRIAALFLQFFVFKIFSYISYRLKAFTSYLILTEDYIQKFFYIVSRGPFSTHGIIVIFFTLFFITTSLYDSLLWALDRPGYVSRSNLVKGSEVVDKLLASPTYVVQMVGGPGEVNKTTPEVIGTELFNTGFNFTLTDKFEKGTRKVGRLVQLNGNDDVRNNFFMNFAKGFGNDCTTAAVNRVPHKNVRFLGEVDTKLVFIIGGILGENDNGTSAGTLNLTTLAWLRDNNQRISDLMASRAYLQTVDPNFVSLWVSTSTPAISYLQIFLARFPVILAGIFWLVIRKADAHHQNTLFANLMASAHKGHVHDSDSEVEGIKEKDCCKNPGHVRGKRKEVSLVQKDGHVELTINGKVVKLADESLNGSMRNSAEQREAVLAGIDRKMPA